MVSGSVDSQKAELIGEMGGIFAGDGTLYTTKQGKGHVLEVRGNSDEIEYYENHVKFIFGKMFQKNLKVIKRYYPNKTGHVIGIRICGKEVKELIHDILGFPIGKKSDIVEIPQVIVQNKDAWESYIRGVFDTDGSFYIRKSGPKLKG